VNHCTQCGEETEIFYEGYCRACSDMNQAELDDHNHNYDRWQRLSDSQKDSEIKQAMNGLWV